MAVVTNLGVKEDWFGVTTTRSESARSKKNREIVSRREDSIFENNCP